MQHIKSHTTYAGALKKAYLNAPKVLLGLSDINLVKIALAGKNQSEQAKIVIINRYIPKIFKESKKIFGFSFQKEAVEDNLQAGIKAILISIKDFNFKKINSENQNGIFTQFVCFNINKYLNRKKTKYDPLLKINQGPEFKKVFYKYYNGKNIEKKDSIVAEEKRLRKVFNCRAETLREVSYIHSGNNNNLFFLDQEDNQNFVDSNNFYSDYVVGGNQDNLDPEKKLEKKQDSFKDISKFKSFLTSKEWEVLDRLNNKETRDKIINMLKISDKRFYAIIQNIKSKINSKSVEKNNARNI
tara:strand:- start:865 stop:1761 length:897 start_codon:yes stop_codon:yes gene_type:complete